MLHILSSRQGFALSPSVALTAGSVLLPAEYKQTSLLQSMTRIHSRLGFYFFSCFSFSLVLTAPGVSGEVWRVGSGLVNPLSHGSRQIRGTAKQLEAVMQLPPRPSQGEESTHGNVCVPPALSRSHQGSQRACSLLAEHAAPAISANGSQARAGSAEDAPELQIYSAILLCK